MNLSTDTLAAVAAASLDPADQPPRADVVASPQISVSDVVVDESQKFLEFVVSLHDAGTGTVTVDYATVAGSAQHYYDYSNVSGTLRFAPGETRKLVRVDLVTDGSSSRAEPLERFTLVLSKASGGSIVDGIGEALIVDNDVLDTTPELHVRALTVDEASGKAVFMVMLGRNGGQQSSSTVTVDYSTSGGTATSGVDFTAASGTLSFAPGESLKLVEVALNNDSLAEGSERFYLNLSNPGGLTLNQPQVMAEILANDATPVGQPRISVADVVIDEAEGLLEFVVSLSAPGTGVVTVDYATVAGSAQHYYDYSNVSGTLRFAPGETVKVVRVEMVVDGSSSRAEALERFTLQLSNASGGSIIDAVGEALVVDNDVLETTPELHVRALTVDEASGRAVFMVTLGRNGGQQSSSTVTVDYRTGGGTAVAGEDFTATSGTLSFAPGESLKLVEVLLNDDTVAEGTERFTLNLSQAEGASLNEPSALAEIFANDAPAVGQPRISVGDVVIDEAEGLLEFVVSLSAPGTGVVTVDYATVAGSAQHYYDYSNVSGTLRFAPGETVKVVRVEMVVDGSSSRAEALERFTLQLSNASGGSIIDAVGEALVVDNDVLETTPELHVRALTVDEASGRAVFMVMLGRNGGQQSTSTVTVDYATSGGTATSGVDFTPTSGTLSFAPGESLKRVEVLISDDAAAEGTERLYLNLSNPGGASLNEPRAMAEVFANDAPAVGQPRISVANVVVDESEGMLEFVVRLGAPGTGVVTVDYATVAGSAQHYYDYSNVSGSLRFAPGETVKVVRVEMVVDGSSSRAEALERFTLQLSNASGGSIVDAVGEALVFDNDVLKPTPELHVRDALVDESSGRALFLVTLGRNGGEQSSSTVTVDYATSAGTARAGLDFTPVSGSLSFAPGESMKWVEVLLVDDNLHEGAERFGLRLSNAGGATLADPSAVALIGSSDGPLTGQPKISIGDLVVSEAEGLMELRVTLSAPSASAVTVDFSTQAGTAQHYYDYTTISGSLRFAPGETTQLVRIEMADNDSVEPAERFTVVLSKASGGSILDGTAEVQILDDDGSASPSQGLGLGDDLYTIYNATDGVAESAQGGWDTVVAAVNYTLPTHVEALKLVDGALNGTGHAGPNWFRGNTANNSFDGKEGIDTAVFSGPAAAYAVSGTVTSRTVSGGADGRDTLLSVERLQFSDQILASDTTPGGNTYAAYALWMAAFNSAPGTRDLSQWTAAFDQYGNGVDVAQELINTYAPGVPNEVLVAHLWSTLIGGSIAPADLATFTGLIENGTFTQASLLDYVSTLSFNTAELAGIVGQTLTLDVSFFPVL